MATNGSWVAICGFFAVAQDYPQLKPNENFLELQRRIIRYDYFKAAEEEKADVEMQF